MLDVVIKFGCDCCDFKTFEPFLNIWTDCHSAYNTTELCDTYYHYNAVAGKVLWQQNGFATVGKR